MLPATLRPALAADLLPPGTPFSFDELSNWMQARAAESYVEPEKITGFAAELDYDDQAYPPMDNPTMVWSLAAEEFSRR